MLTTANHLRDHLSGLDKDLEGLRGKRVALLGFRDPNEHRVEDNLRVLRETSPWVLIDLRSSQLQRLPEALISKINVPKIVIIVDTTATLPNDAVLLIRAVHDSKNAVVWSDGTQSVLPTDQWLYVISLGARSIDELPSVLQRIDFMTFIRDKR
jgi:hypothetical protein